MPAAQKASYLQWRMAMTRCDVTFSCERHRAVALTRLQCPVKDVTCGITAHRMAYFMKVRVLCARDACCRRPRYSLQDFIGVYQAMEMDQGGSRCEHTPTNFKTRPAPARLHHT